MRRLPLLGFALALAASAAWAIDEWYDHYLRARDLLIPAGKCAEALKELQAAVRIKPASGLNQITYGLQFVDYLPYYWMGVCYQKTGDQASAIKMFNQEEERRAIQKSPLFKDLIAKRTDAYEAERGRVARQARAEVERLLGEARELARARKYNEALTKLALAEPLAKALDPATQRSVAEARERVQADAQEQAEAAARAQRLEQALQEATRLLEEGRPTEAVVRFDEALSIDARNARALEGKRAAQEQIRASATREQLAARFREGKALFEAGEYEKALRPLTDAAADPANAAARELLERAGKIVEGVRQQKERQARIDQLLARGEAQLASRRYTEATVSFDAVLRLDPGNARAKERLDSAERRVGESIIARYLPNQTPLLTILAPEQGAEILGPTVAVLGVATDDRAMARVEVRIGGRLVREETARPGLDDTETRRDLAFNHRLLLEPGQNEITVTAIDNLGSERRESLVVTRRLRFHETRLFLPSVVGTSLGLLGAGFAVQGYRRRAAVRRRFNPYIAGAPVMDEDMFFGRQKLLARLLNVLHHNSLMITGERRIGKTTFLYHLKKVLAADEGTEYQFFPVLIDLQGVPETQFFAALMSDIVEALAVSSPTRETLRFRPGVERYDGRDFSHDVQRVLDELKTRTSRRVKLALLIDEVDVLNEYSESINQRLRSIFMKTFSESLVAVMSGVGIKRTWKSEVSPWYNFFDEVELSVFTREEAEELIRTPVRGVFRYEGAAIERILELSRLKPYLIQKFCIHAVNRMLEEGRTTVTRADVEAVERPVLLETEAEAAASRPLAVASGPPADL
jgi:tetratricopeptide (TPR) repeat protein